MENKIVNKTAKDIVKMVKEHVKEHSEYTAMSLVNDIVNKNITNKVWEDPDHSIIEKYIGSDIVKELEDAGFKFEFYPYKSHTVIKNNTQGEIVDSWSLALIWYNWTRLDNIFRHYEL